MVFVKEWEFDLVDRKSKNLKMKDTQPLFEFYESVLINVSKVCGYFGGSKLIICER